MDLIAQNFWPVHSIAWFVFALVGAIVGYFLANVTRSTFVNILILIALMVGMSFAVAQAIGMAIDLRAEDVSSWVNFGEFWLRSQDMMWLYDNRVFEVLWSTAIALGICVVFGIILLLAKKERV